MQTHYHNLNETHLQALAKDVAATLSPGDTVYLNGPLGAGKTTFVRALLRAFGFEGSIKSPTFTVVESYEVKQVKIYHFDFYRINDEAELDFLGLDDYFSHDAICFVEWPEKASSLPKATLYCTIALAEQENCRDVTLVREVS